MRREEISQHSLNEGLDLYEGRIAGDVRGTFDINQTEPHDQKEEEGSLAGRGGMGMGDKHLRVSFV